ncbi:hypothetical protein [Muriicola sp.]|uniref:hypothetical protein n=1 Tax=Muriicola sp. TaxID=2020856 RepID=UPI003C74D11F
MKNIKLAFLIPLSLVLTCCSSVKVLNSWKASDVETFRDNNILVVARTANEEARVAFENEITREIRARGMNATPSYTKFPKLRPNDKLTDERKDEIKNLLQKEGFNGVVLSVVKDYQERTRVVGTGGYEASVNYGYTDFPTYFGGGFYVYYNNPLSYSNEDIYVPESEYTITSKLYVLETVAYDLEQQESKQLVAWVTSEIENPSGAAATANSYAKAIAKRFKN